MTLREYLQGQIELIPENSDISNPNVNDGPKIIFVNGHWSSIIPGPSEGGKGYWFDGDAFFNAAAASFNLTSWENKFADGSKWLFNLGASRQESGHNWAKDNYSDLISNSSSIIDFYIVSHSQGGAFSAGIADYLKAKGHIIKQMVFLSCHQGSQIETDTSIKMYQMLYGKWKAIIPNVSYMFIFDPIVGNHMVRGAKYCIIIRQDLDLFEFHGSSNDSYVFLEIDDLRKVKLIDVPSSDGQHTYNGQSQVSNNTRFFTINGTVVQTNIPGFTP